MNNGYRAGSLRSGVFSFSHHTDIPLFPVSLAKEKKVVADVTVNTIISDVKIAIQDRDGYAQKHGEYE
jgi:hypothetical protein